MVGWRIRRRDFDPQSGVSEVDFNFTSANAAGTQTSVNFVLPAGAPDATNAQGQQIGFETVDSNGYSLTTVYDVSGT